MKKIFLFFTILIFLLVGCGQKKEILMDRPAEDGSFYYQNKGLGFALALPPEFLYYQTQRKEPGDFIDLEFFVPTSDTDYQQEVPGYGKPVVVRIFKKEAWEKVGGTDEASDYSEIGEKGGKVYTVKFWENAPRDWGDKWTVDMENGIINSVSVK